MQIVQCGAESLTVRERCIFLKKMNVFPDVISSVFTKYEMPKIRKLEYLVFTVLKI